MERKLLEVGQLLIEHPIAEEKEMYKTRYINTLEYFAEKYSTDSDWSKSTLALYKKKLLTEPDKYVQCDEDIRKISKGVLSWKMKKFKFFTYRACLLIDCLHVIAGFDKNQTKEFWSEFSCIYNERYRKKLEILYLGLFGDEVNTHMYDQIDGLYLLWKKNQGFYSQKDNKIMITANMSAGKSTLLNALIGKKVNKTQNDACTAKVHYLLNKAFEDGLNYEWDFDLELDATNDILMTDNENNGSKEITVGTRFRSVKEIDKSIWFIDTPGVNSSFDKEHKEISNNAIMNMEYDVLLFLLNGQNIGTDDDKTHLRFVAENYKGRVIFVVNKLDSFKAKEDSIEETLNTVVEELKSLGFSSPNVCPISAYAAYLSKMSMFDESLNEDEQDELERFERKLNKKVFHLNEYYCDDIKNRINENTIKEEQKTLLYSGILSLEKIIYNF